MTTPTGTTDWYLLENLRKVGLEINRENWIAVIGQEESDIGPEMEARFPQEVLDADAAE
jgi:hypothetical protein